MEFLSSTWGFVLIVVLALWDIAIRLYTLWLSARKGQTAWFVCLGIFSTIGILPLVYLLISKKRG